MFVAIGMIREHVHVCTSDCILHWFTLTLCMALFLFGVLLMTVRGTSEYKINVLLEKMVNSIYNANYNDNTKYC